MTRGLYNAASGMVREIGHQDIIANNLANLNTAGYKRDVPLSLGFNQLLQRYMDGSAFVANVPPDSTLSPEITFGVDISQGPVASTGNPLDLALEGKGFFVVETPQGRAFTRQGNFRVDERGYLVTQQGHRVLSDRDAPIQLDGEYSVRFDAQGNIYLEGEDLEIATLRIVELPPGTMLQKTGNGLLTAAGVNGVPARETTLKQGYLEQSNVNPIEEMVAMIVAFRNYEAAQRMVQGQDEATQKAIEEVGSVRS
jgi:flagellar basal-body rod protein FlgG